MSLSSNDYDINNATFKAINNQNMNKVEPIGKQYQIVKYGGFDSIVLSKTFETIEQANLELDKMNKSKKPHADSFPLINQLLNYAIEDITLAKEHGNIAITDTKCGIVQIEFLNNVFRMKYGDKRLITDNEIMVVEILKGLYNFEIVTTNVKNKPKKTYL